MIVSITGKGGVGNPQPREYNWTSGNQWTESYGLTGNSCPIILPNVSQKALETMIK